MRYFPRPECVDREQTTDLDYCARCGASMRLRLRHWLTFAIISVVEIPVSFSQPRYRALVQTLRAINTVSAAGQRFVVSRGVCRLMDLQNPMASNTSSNAQPFSKRSAPASTESRPSDDEKDNLTPTPGISERSPDVSYATPLHSGGTAPAGNDTHRAASRNEGDLEPALRFPQLR